MLQHTMKFSLPDFADSFNLNLVFVQLVSRNPVLLQKNVGIESVYGCFPSCPLNGGRAFVRERYTHEDMEATFAAFAEYGVSLRLTLTNMLAAEEHLQDPYVNDMLELGGKYGAEVIAYSDLVRDYAKERYGMGCVLSTTREITTAREFNKMARCYDAVVLNFNYNKDRGFIDAIDDKSKIEVMVNEYCSHGCPQRQKHYLHNSQDQMNNILSPYNCRADKIRVFLKHEPGDPVFFTNDEIERLHFETGIDHFKIVGRGIPFDIVLESYVYYLIKPEYRRDVKRVVEEAMQHAQTAIMPAQV